MISKAKAIKDGKETDLNKYTFMGGDIVGVCKQVGITDATVAEIYKYYRKGYSIDDCKKAVQHDIEEIENSPEKDSTIIVSTSYIPIDEYPPDEYYDTTGYGNENGKPLPEKETLEKYSKMLEELGFVNINKLVAYEMKVAYIYPNNEVSKKVLEFINNM